MLLYCGDSIRLIVLCCSMRRSSRNTPRIDYKIFHQTGQKVSTIEAEYNRLAEWLDKDSIMEKNQLVDDDNVISLEIVGFMEEYELDDLYGVEDIEKCILELKQSKKRFEEVHVKLKRVLEDAEHDILYENYDDDVRRMTDWVKDARKEISKRKKRRISKKGKRTN